MKNKTTIWLIAATLLGAFLRFNHLTLQPIWMDEALLGGGFLKQQEFIGNLLVVHSDFWLRFPYALAGTLTIPASFYVIKNKQIAIIAAFFIAVFPLFVFWSRLARPYALAGLFVVLAWRYWWFMFPAILTTPAALLGWHISKRYWQFAALAALAFFLYYIRHDVQGGSDFINIHFLSTNPRTWYVPLLICILYFSDYLLPQLLRKYPKLRKW